MFTFREVTPSDAKLILDWRTKKRVTDFLNTDISYDIAAQESWVSSSFSKDNYYHWVIQQGGKDIGLINFVDWNREEKTISWGLYVGEDEALGFGGMVPPFFYNFCFGKLGVEKVRAEVFYNNLNTINLHLLHGYQFVPSRDYVIEKREKHILIVCLELERSVFNGSKFTRFKSDFPVQKWKYKALINE